MGCKVMSEIKTPLENYVIRALRLFMVGKGTEEYQRAIHLILDGVVDDVDDDEYETGKGIIAKWCGV